MVEHDIQSICEGKIYDPEPINHYKIIKERSKEYLDKLKDEEPRFSEDEVLSNKDPYTLIKIKQQDKLDELKNIKVKPPVDDDCNENDLSETASHMGMIGPKTYKGSNLLTDESHKNFIDELHGSSSENKYEMVDHPQHYGGKDNPYEAIKVIEAWGLNFNLGSALKYISRKNKPDALLDDRYKRLEDLKKAAWYLNREVERYRSEMRNSR